MVGKYPGADWDEVYARHSRRLYHRVLNIVRNPEDAEDALQEGLMSAFRNFHRFEGRSGFSTWLTRIVVNAALMQLRCRRTHQAVSLDEPVDDTGLSLGDRVADPAPSPEELCALAEQGAILDRRVTSLSADLETALRLHYLEGFSIEEAARTCRTGVSTMKSRLRRARQRLAGSEPFLKKWQEGEVTQWSQANCQ
jgi:RNA polymerase sigma-70 factor (ECF subfamily)